MRANVDLTKMIFGGRSFSGREKHCVFLNTGALPSQGGGPQFATVSAVSGLDLDDDGRAVALVDWDFDGDQDVWISNRNAPRLRFLRNDAETHNHFLALRLQGNGTTTNRDAIGARVELYLGGGPPRITTLRAGEGFLAQSTKWLHFGLGQADHIDRLVVKWPGGDAETIEEVAVDSHVLVVQGAGQAKAAAPRSTPPELQPSTLEVPLSTDTARIPLAYRLPMVPVPYEDHRGEQKVLRFDTQRPLLINLWASWCQPCLQELSDFADRSAELQAAGVDVFALSVDGLNDDSSSSDAARELVDRMRFPFRTGQATSALLSTFQSLHDRQIPMRRPLPLPTSFLIDAHGDLAVIYKGPLNIDDVLADAARVEARFEDAAPLIGRTIDDPRIISIRKRVETIVRFRLGIDLETSGQWQEAARHYQRVLEVEPEYAEAHNNLGNVLVRLNRIREAELHLRRAIELNRDLDLAHHNLANILLQQRRIPEAIGQYTESVRLAPDHAGYRYSLGNALLSIGDFRSAAASFQKAIELDGQLADAYNNLGFAWEKLGKPTEAEEAYRRTLEVDPRHRNAALNLARLRQARAAVDGR